MVLLYLLPPARQPTCTHAEHFLSTMVPTLSPLLPKSSSFVQKPIHISTFQFSCQDSILNAGSVLKFFLWPEFLCQEGELYKESTQVCIELDVFHLFHICKFFLPLRFNSNTKPGPQAQRECLLNYIKLAFILSTIQFLFS